jgi:hypothetical protein
MMAFGGNIHSELDCTSLGDTHVLSLEQPRWTVSVAVTGFGMYIGSGSARGAINRKGGAPGVVVPRHREPTLLRLRVGRYGIRSSHLR